MRLDAVLVLRALVRQETEQNLAAYWLVLNSVLQCWQTRVRTTGIFIILKIWELMFLFANQFIQEVSDVACLSTTLIQIEKH
ncbi:hypothetical protein C1896_07835 [Pseudomonadaceae bacterium SI-3]|nr:hypothetical protein C1896_07835 [Pseudomonadaceae bacterium SI-3]